MAGLTMGEKSGAGKLNHEERQERILFAISIITTTGKTRGVAPLVRAEYGCSTQTAQRIVRAAVSLVSAGLPAMVNEMRTRALLVLGRMVDDPDEDNAGVRASLKMLIDLMGLAAPTRSEIVVAERPRDTLAEFAARPDLLERQLKLEEELEDARSNPVPVEPGAFGLPPVAIPTPPPATPAASDPPADRPDV